LSHFIWFVCIVSKNKNDKRGDGGIPLNECFKKFVYVLGSSSSHWLFKERDAYVMAPPRVRSEIMADYFRFSQLADDEELCFEYKLKRIGIMREKFKEDEKMLANLRVRESNFLKALGSIDRIRRSLNKIYDAMMEHEELFVIDDDGETIRPDDCIQRGIHIQCTAENNVDVIDYHIKRLYLI